MGLFSFSKKKDNYCIFCGNVLADGKCPACGREEKAMVPPSAFAFEQVPTSIADELGVQKKQLFGNPMFDIQEMIRNGGLAIADVHIDGVYERRSELDEDDPDDFYYIQFSRPDLTPCEMDCEASQVFIDSVEELLRRGEHSAKLLRGVLKKKEYYYVFVPESDDLAEMLKGDLAMEFILYGTLYTERKKASKRR